MTDKKDLQNRYTIINWEYQKPVKIVLDVDEIHSELKRDDIKIYKKDLRKALDMVLNHIKFENFEIKS